MIKKVASEMKKSTNSKISPKTKNIIPEVKNKPPPSEYGTFPKTIICDVLQHKDWDNLVFNDVLYVDAPKRSQSTSYLGTVRIKVDHSLNSLWHFV